ncbi:MAG TPA: DNA topoisomerase VI subunit B [Candidatus Caldiarchaeum subterraneum]|uniref:Type 2 DNA topoisomerase 6 subunit B n=1 Tax=Caldiarchaeum subterraneum TaxID=311458 RepID=A0A832ZW41_CALS0|nr:DNA topoisomerase VI subunit B [Candidatus Caldarchaeum subterraneum]
MVESPDIKFEQISPSEFFYKNRDIAGFSSPSRSLYMSIRELVENALDAAEVGRILPEVYVQLTLEKDAGEESDVKIYKLRVEDDGIGVAGDYIPKAFATVLYGSKYGYRQSRGTFGLGGTMALLYGQITTNRPATVISSTGGKEIHKYQLMIDVIENKPRIISHEVLDNRNKWRGTIIEFYLEADYTGSRAKIIEYFRNTAIVNPHATITFEDSRGRLYHFPRVIEKVPEPPRESKPHPVGVDVETMSRLLAATKASNLIGFLTSAFQKVGEKTARDILELAKIPYDLNPRRLTHEQVTELVEAIKKYGKFRAPDPTPLSPIGEEFLESGIRQMLKPDFLYVVQRPPASYSGYPFVVEAAVAYGGDIPPSDSIHLFRFANKIPLLYDERADVVWKVVTERIDWTTYKVPKVAPLAVITSICSPKIPYKTVGKEAIADRPEIERELTTAIRECARHLKLYLSRIEKREAAAKRLSIYAKYLPKIAEFAAKAAEKPQPPDVMPLLKKIGVTKEMVDKAREEEQAATELL